MTYWTRQQISELTEDYSPEQVRAALAMVSQSEETEAELETYAVCRRDYNNRDEVFYAIDHNGGGFVVPSEEVGNGVVAIANVPDTSSLKIIIGGLIEIYAFRRGREID